MTTERHQKLREHAAALGDLLVEKQAQYGDSVGSTGAILRQLYPDGIRPDQYDNLQLVVRVLDKLKRIASQGPDGADRGGESPWRDVGGYGILGLAQTEHRDQSRNDVVEAVALREGFYRAYSEARQYYDRIVTLVPLDSLVRSQTCHGCKHYRFGRCHKTNRPSADSVVDPDAPSPSWCPGREASR